MLNNKPKHILIAPLDWGLGHTARCIPVIQYLKSLGHLPIVACNASQRSFIEETLGETEIVHLEGYNITYSHWNKWAQAGILAQLPRIKRAIKSENKWLRKLCSERQINGIISDNRYGLYNCGVSSVILTHQLQVQTGFGAIANRTVQKLHYKYLDRFDAAWVADNEGIPNLGGNLSHSSRLPRHSRYVGLLSRFAAAKDEIVFTSGEGSIEDTKQPGPLLMLLSGPEPQRSVLSAMLWKQAVHYDGVINFIEGSEHAVAPENIPSHIHYYKRLAGSNLQPLLHAARMVICRSGYSTIMDLVAMNKRAILIPTPGQTEQEYLGRYLHTQGAFYSATQKRFNLEVALNKASAFPFNSIPLRDHFSCYQRVISQWLTTL